MSEEWKSMARQVADLRQALAEVTRERDQYKAAYELQYLLAKAAHKGESHEH